MTLATRLAASLGGLALLFSAVPAVAQQDVTVIVLGIRSVEGDDEFARDLTGALRHAASQVEGWQVSERDVSLAQMILANGCGEPDAACMGEIASGLQVQRIIYGTVSRTSTRATSDFRLALSMFDGERREIAGEVNDNIPGRDTDVDALRLRVRRYVRTLSGAAEAGMLRVATNLPGAQVLVDGEEVGLTDTDGAFSSSTIAAGTHRVEVRAEGHQRFRGTVTVVAGEEASIEVTLQEGEDPGEGPGGGGEGGGGGVNVLAFGLLGVGVVGAAIWIIGYFNVDSLDNNPAMVEYRDTTPRGENACDRAAMLRSSPDPMMSMDARRVHDICSEADTFFIVTLIGAGLTILGGAGGIGLLTLDFMNDDGDSDQESSDVGRLHLSPSVRADGASLSASLRF